MATVKQTAVRFTPDDLELLDALQRKTGIQSRTDVLRMAIRALAEAHGVTIEPAKPQRPKPKR